MSAKLKCTYCGGTQFYEGPSGGMSTNVLCANDKCRHWFNSTPFGFDDLNRIEPSDEEKTAEAERRAREAEAKPGRLMAEGFGLYFGGKAPEDCLTEKPYNNYAASHDSVYRLCGYISAMREDLKKPVR